MFDKTDIDEISHEAKIVEHEIEITSELEKAKMDKVENSSDGLLDWLTIISDGYLEKYDDED
ncbi:7202_t:CDS:1, partial [Gigaspora rosea]